MRIGIDVRPLQNNNLFRGTGRYLACLLEALSAIGNDHEYLFYAETGAPAPDVLELFDDKRVVCIPYTRFFRRRFLRSVLPQHGRLQVSPTDVDVFLQIDASLGVPRSVPTVVAFLDAIPYLFRDRPVGRTLRRRAYEGLILRVYWVRYRRMLRSFRHAAAVVAISECARRDFDQYVDDGWRIPVTVTPLAPLPRHTSQSMPSARSMPSVGGARSPYLLYVGGIDLRKNVVALARDFFAVHERFPDLQLVVVGREFELDERQLRRVGWDESVTAHESYDHIVKTGYVDDDDLATLYEHASAFVFPSRYEGFGLPLLEAMQAGCPVVAYRNSSIPEVVGDAALLVADGESMAPAIERILAEPGVRDELVAKGRVQASRFSWERTARQTLDVLRSTAVA